jgi:hypothetical protein
VQNTKSKTQPVADSNLNANERFTLSEVEVETLRRAAVARGLPFDPTRTEYTLAQLRRYGLVREGYTRQELRERGVVPRIVSSLDHETDVLMEALPIETPFGSGIRKYELPIDMLPLRVSKTIFPPATRVSSHVHPPHSDDSPGGGLRLIASGSIVFGGRTYESGDWFFVPNGEPYEFETDPNMETVVFYKYSFFAVEKGNRFSAPIES